jgi:hypothetical protein
VTEASGVHGDACRGCSWRRMPLSSKQPEDESIGIDKAEGLSSALDRGLTGRDTCHHVIGHV